MTTARCERQDRDEVAERYVTGRLNQAEAVEWENHLVACAECQRAVTLAVSVSRTLRGATPSGAAPRRTPRRWGVWIGAATVAAAAAVAIMAYRVPSAELRALGAVAEPPTYLGVPVRSALRPGDSLFSTAMVAYEQRKYSEAAAGLRAALAAGADSVATNFFLAASELMLGDAAPAASGFAAVIAAGPSGYHDEAVLYRAKALLRIGKASEAVDVLQTPGVTDPGLAAQVAALADSVRRAAGK